jgi:hypothetical protein
MTVEGHESVVLSRLCQMHCIREVHAASHPSQCLVDERRVLKRHRRKAREGTHRLVKLRIGKSLDATQNPLCLQQNRRADEYGISIDQGLRLN